MKKFVSSVALGCLVYTSMLSTPASAQVVTVTDGFTIVTPLSVKRFSNGLYIDLVERWNTSSGFNSMTYTLQKVNCQNRTGTLTYVSGNLGTQLVTKRLNYPVQFNDGSLLDRSVLAVCSREDAMNRVLESFR
ncbi:MAG: hypothetical protein WBA39_07915 [Rivularia sp. (in: cyanobacteria)]